MPHAEARWQTTHHCLLVYNFFRYTETRYSTLERELLAIRWGIKKLSPFLMFTKFIMYTDHKSLCFLHNMSITNSRLMRTFSDLSEYDFEIRYRPGSESVIADQITRSLASWSLYTINSFTVRCNSIGIASRVDFKAYKFLVLPKSHNISVEQSRT